MYSRVLIRWNPRPNERGELTGIAELHSGLDAAFLDESRALTKGQFEVAVGLNGGSTSLRGMDGDSLPPMSGALTKQVTDTMRAYASGYSHETRGKPSVCLWMQEADHSLTPKELADLRSMCERVIQYHPPVEDLGKPATEIECSVLLRLLDMAERQKTL